MDIKHFENMNLIPMVNWEGAEICYYVNGERHAIPLSNVQFAVVAKILGLEVLPDGSIQQFTDDTLRRFTAMRGNLLRLEIPPMCGGEFPSTGV